MVVATLLTLTPAILIAWDAQPVLAAKPTHPDRDPTVGTALYHTVLAVQGDDPATAGVEPDGSIAVLSRTQWSIPRETEEVFVPVPGAARNVAIDQVEPYSHQGYTLYRPGVYSREANPLDSYDSVLIEDGKWEGYYSWRFPKGADRNTTSDISFTTDDDFLENYDPEQTTIENWTIDGGSLSLVTGNESAIYTNKKTIAGNDILSITGFYILSGDGDNVTIQVTEDDGATWVDLENGARTEMTGQGPLLRWRVMMEQNTSLNNTPVLEHLELSVTYLTINTVLWIQTEYLLDIPDDGVEFDLEFTFDYEATTLVIVGYFDNDLKVTVEGMQVTPGTNEGYPGKTSYRLMGGPFESTVTFKVEPPSNGDGATDFLLVFGLPLAIIVLLLVAFMASGGRSRPASSRSDRDPGEPGEDDGSGRMSGDDPDTEALAREKDRLLGEISRLDDQLAEGTIDEEEHAVARAELKALAVDVMRRQKAGGR